MNRIRIQKVRGRHERRWLEVLPRLRVATWTRRQGVGDPKSLPAWFVHSGEDDLGVRRNPSQPQLPGANSPPPSFFGPLRGSRAAPPTIPA